MIGKLFMMGRHNISYIFQVRTVIHQAKQIRFINHLLTGSINQQTVFRHTIYQVIVNRVFGFGSSRNVQRHHVTSSIQLFSRINRFYTISLHHLFRTISIISINIHTDSFCYTSHIASYITVCMNTQLLAHQFRTRFAVVKITNRHNHHTESQLSNGI